MIVIHGKPQSKQRPRFSRGRVYTPSNTLKFENEVKNAYKKSGEKLFEGAIKINGISYFAIPKSYSNKDRKRIKDRNLLVTKKPDIDNLMKAVLDGLNGVAYKDDSQIVEINWKKEYTFDDKGRTEIKIMEV